MVARISTGKSIRGMLHYNENKVEESEADLILASGFAGEIGQMSFNQKLNRFNHLLQLKPDVKTNAVHISLNFHSSEQLDDFTLQQIAVRYMEKIGFGDQPFLVYRHDDAAHQHLHIVTTNITAEAQRIDLHDIGKLKSEPARKDIEEDFNLIKAESKAFKSELGIKKVDLKKVKYGKIPTKRAISNTITAVTRDYKFTSLAEYNAILRCFNVTALRGEEHTPMFENKGLMFSLIDEDGKAVGVPVKSSSFYNKPTLRNLEKKFEQNVPKKEPFKNDLKTRIDQIFKKYSNLNEQKFKEAALKLGIDVLFRKSAQGLIFGVTFIDHKNKVVFNGKGLGEAFRAKAIIDKFNNQTKTVERENSKPLISPMRKNQDIPFIPESPSKPERSAQIIEMFSTKVEYDNTIGVPRKRKKRKKRNQQVSQEFTI